MAKNSKIREALEAVLEESICAINCGTRDVLEDACSKAFNHAESGVHETGSCYWMTMFVDKLQEELDLEFT